MHKLSGQLTVNLRAIANNWRLLSDKVGPAVECSAVVKADAYGLGVEAVAPRLYREGCKHFFVATCKEGLQLRKLLGDAAVIYVLQGVWSGDESIFLAHRLIPVIISDEMLRRWFVYVRDNPSITSIPPYAIKLNTGMHRLGLESCELEDALKTLPPSFWRECCLCVSHLACADEPEQPLNAHQYQAFIAAVQQLKAVVPAVRLSLANSSGIFLGPDWHFDIVRPGCALYGINPTPYASNAMACVARLTLPVLQLRHIKAGASVGYGAEYCAPKDGLLAVVSGGYAEGVLRSASPDFDGVMCGVAVPVVGRVSMDSVVFDVSAVQSNDLQAQVIEVFGPNRSIDLFASNAQTIAYEVLTRLGGRLEKVYVDQW